MAVLSPDEIDRRLGVAARLDARRRRDHAAVHVRRLSGGGRVRRPARAGRRGRGPSSRHHDQLQARHARLLDAQRRRADREGFRRRGARRSLRREMRLKKTYSSREVAALTGLTARQLQIWDAGGLLSPAIPSHRTNAGGYTERRYTPIELFELLVLGRPACAADSPSTSCTDRRRARRRSSTRVALRGDRRRRRGAAADRRRAHARAHRARRVLQPAGGAGAAAARGRQRAICGS